MKAAYEDLYGVIGCEVMGSGDDEEAVLLKELLSDAERYVSKFAWCKAIRGVYFGIGVGGVFAVFLFAIDNSASPGDDLIWVVVGDIPPAYLVVRDGPQDAKEALGVYLELMREWVDAVRKGMSTSGLIPVNAIPSPKYAEMLGSRLDDLQCILSAY